MHTEKLTPLNELESLLVEAQQGARPIGDLFRGLVAGELFIVSTEDVLPGAEGISPLLFDRAGVAMAAVFTDQARAARFGAQVKGVIRMNGGQMFRYIPTGYGVVINPGFDVGLELLPDGLKNVIEQYCP